jgi:hypothetical protein
MVREGILAPAALYEAAGTSAQEEGGARPTLFVGLTIGGALPPTRRNGGAVSAPQAASPPGVSSDSLLRAPASLSRCFLKRS